MWPPLSSGLASPGHPWSIFSALEDFRISVLLVWRFYKAVSRCGSFIPHPGN